MAIGGKENTGWMHPAYVKLNGKILFFFFSFLSFWGSGGSRRHFVGRDWVNFFNPRKKKNPRQFQKIQEAPWGQTENIRGKRRWHKHRRTTSTPLLLCWLMKWKPNMKMSTIRIFSPVLLLFGLCVCVTSVSIIIIWESLCVCGESRRHNTQR